MKTGLAPIQSRSPNSGTAGPDEVRDPVAALEANLTEPNPFYAGALVDPALALLDPGQSVRMVDAFNRRGTLIGRLPLVASAMHGRFPVRHAANWMHRHCFYGAPLLRRGQEEEAWAAILHALDAAPWSGGFLHLRGVDPDGPALAALQRVCAAQGRRYDQVERHERAILRSDRDARVYWESNVRAKKRKDLRRLQHRLAEEGAIVHRHLDDPADLPAWIDAFLMLEAKGWKGVRGTALSSCEDDAAFLRRACANALAAGQLDMLRIDCADRPIAMLINFVGADGGFSFKIAVDPAFARYSPGVLIEQDNLARVLDDHVAPWMDSCAAPGHPMIDSLWGERRVIAQYRIALHKPGLAGLASRLSLPVMTLGERSFAWIKSGNPR